MSRGCETRTFLSGHHYLFPSQIKSAKPCTHTLLCGGIVVLPDARAYRETYERIAADVCKDAGRICLCENFPRIYGRWRDPETNSAPNNEGQRRPRYPPPDLVTRAARVLQMRLEQIGPAVLDRDARVKKRQPGEIEWRECTFALDLDYGPMTAAGYNIDEIVKDIQVVQRVMIECGAKPSETRCYVCIADTLGSLGVHAYFPFSSYYPEECMQLATVVLARLQEERPLHMGNGRFWHQIVDVGIYNGSLRVVGVQKASRCPLCQNKVADKKKCKNCKGQGVEFKDRRYWPRFYLNERHEIDPLESRWMLPVAQYVRSKLLSPKEVQNLPPLQVPTPSAAVETAKSMDSKLERSSSLLRPISNVGNRPLDAAKLAPITIGDDDRCIEFLKALLYMCSLRLLISKTHTVFSPPPDSPRPNFPRAWIEFFRSVVDAGQRIPQPQPDPAAAADRPTSVADAVDRINTPTITNNLQPAQQDEGPNDGKTVKDVVGIVTAPWASPAGETMSLVGSHAVEGDVPSWKLRQQERTMREKYEHLLVSPSDSLDEAKKMASGLFSEFRKSETVANDPEGRCQLLQAYLRGWTHNAYAKLQVVKVNHSLGYGNTLVHVRGPGQHFCQIAARHHGKNIIFFLVRRRTGELTQHCFHKECVGRHFSFGPIAHDDVRVLFSPLEFLQKTKVDERTPEQDRYATKLCASSKALSVKHTRCKIKHKGKVMTRSVPPPTPSGRPQTPLMSPSPYGVRYEDVALGDRDDDGEPDDNKKQDAKKSHKQQRPPSPDYVEPLAPEDNEWEGPDNGGTMLLPLTVPQSPPQPTSERPTEKKAPVIPVKLSGAQVREMHQKLARRPAITLAALPNNNPAPSGHESTKNTESAKEIEHAKEAEARDLTRKRRLEEAASQIERVAANKRRRLNSDLRPPLPSHILSIRSLEPPAFKSLQQLAPAQQPANSV